MAKKQRHLRDPHRQREAEKYSNPIPSREFISAHLARRKGPASHPKLCAELGLSSDDSIEALRRRLIAMVRDGQLLCSRRGDYGLIDKMDLVRGRVHGHPDGYGFLVPDLGGEDYLLNHRQMSCCFDGDVVLVRKGRTNHRGRVEATIVEVVMRNTHECVGRFRWQSGLGLVQPENKRITQDILIPPQAVADASDGDIVVVSISEQPEFRRQPVGEVKQVLGAHLAPGMEIDIALQTHALPHQWPHAVLNDCAALHHDIAADEYAARVDLTSKAMVTIDGEDARDFDDAVYAQPMKNNGIRLFVAIADVSHYVGVATPLDEEARLRGTSVYFPERVVPMLPEVLSNDLCSLKPRVDRLAMVCVIEITAAGEVDNFRFMEAVIHSHARLTYTQVAGVLDKATPEQRAAVGKQAGKAVLTNIDTLYQLYQRLVKARSQRGAIDYETQETRILFNADKKIERIVSSERNDAHRLIEECMLVANVCTAEFLQRLKIPALYRVHAGPSSERLQNLRAYLGEYGLNVGGGDKPHAKDYQELLRQIRQRDDFELLQSMMLRSMAQAVYQPENIGHFGLAYQRYAHFTSPIRRYPDLLVHRAVRSVIRSNRRTALVRRVRTSRPSKPEQHYPYDAQAVVELGEHCSMTERRADEATADVIAWLKCHYMQGHIGDEFTGRVSGVTSFGLFVQLSDIYVDGLVHVSSLQSDYYHYQEASHRLVGERTRTVYGLGDELLIRVMRVDLDERKIDFELAAGHSKKARTSQGKPAARRRATKAVAPPKKKKKRLFNK